MSFFKKIFGIESKEDNVESSPVEHAPDTFYINDDNYLVLEILPKEGNIAIQELSFTDAKPILGGGVQMSDKLIDIESIISVINETGLQKIEKVAMEGVGLLEEDGPLCFGGNKYALLLNEKNGVLQNIWLEGKTETEEEIQQITNTLFTLGQIFDFVAVNWDDSTKFDLSIKEDAEDFVRSSLK